MERTDRDGAGEDEAPKGAAVWAHGDGAEELDGVPMR